ncbi:enteropeptidase [Strongylocentrotus purpuratus]|uniref:Uncharacterized protein n=1 Tax=Strongylocentrotus purpuratus TaxID=7668 RepID=A0A7M7TGS3_STRPU|nr:enteropeptidase [Strongylocentrotus purpuratus]
MAQPAGFVLLLIVACLVLCSGERPPKRKPGRYDALFDRSRIVSCSGNETISLSAGDYEWISSHETDDDAPYPNDLQCVWIIEAPNNYRVTILVEYFALEFDYDILYFGSGDENIGDDPEGELTGTIRRGTRFISDGRTMWIAFVTDDSVRDLGFGFNITVVHKSDIIRCDNDQGIIEDDLCDGIVNCEDLSDETDCDCEEYTCENNICIADDQVCDGVNDCIDFSDETDCPNCRKFNHRQCAARLDYKRSYFPNAMVTTHRKGKREYRIVRRIANCHEMFLTAACSMLFPQCTAGTTTVARICKSLCYEIEESCRGDFENLEMGDWPVECEMHSDENPDGEGFCDGPEGDYSGLGTCGERPTYSRIVGGVDAIYGEWPFIGSLRSRGGHVCGATLINPGWAVTAAHCLYAFNRITLGDLQLDSETSASFTTNIADQIGHEWYDDDSTDYDYAMLRLEERAPIGNYIQPACLAESHREHESYRNCYIVGWGLTAEDGDIANTVQKAHVKLIDFDECNAAYDFELNERIHICAGYMVGGIDTCQGDSGGPLICEGVDGRQHLVGATSFGYGCARRGSPGVYARISSMTEWMQDVMDRYAEDGDD